MKFSRDIRPAKFKNIVEAFGTLLPTSLSIEYANTDDEIMATSFFSIDTFFGKEIDATTRSRLQREQFSLWKRRYGSQQKEGERNPAVILVAKQKGDIVGCVTLSARPYRDLGLNQPDYPWVFNVEGRNKGDRVPILANIAVSPSLRRQGIGEKLANRCEELAKDWGYSEVKTFHSHFLLSRLVLTSFLKLSMF
jgi:predicted N-acetyltransferase YhbS